MPGGENNMVTLKEGTTVWLRVGSDDFGDIMVAERNVVFDESEILLCYSDIGRIYYVHIFQTPKAYENKIIKSYSWWKE